MMRKQNLEKREKAMNGRMWRAQMRRKTWNRAEKMPKVIEGEGNE